MRAFDQLGAGLHADRILSNAQASRIAPRLAGADVELPAVPGTFHHLTRPRIAILARHLRLDQPGLDAIAKTAAAVRATIVERKEIAGEIEHHDGAAVHVDELAGARRDLIDARNHVAGHWRQSSR